MTSEMDRGHIYLAIDLKSFYASVECRERGLNPMTTNLVVADKSRTEKTICLAVSPSLKKYEIPGRARLFEVVQRVREINAGRKRRATGHRFYRSVLGMTVNYRKIRIWRWIIWWHRRAWLYIWNTAQGSTRFICSILRRKICMSIPLTRCFLILPIICMYTKRHRGSWQQK